MRKYKPYFLLVGVVFLAGTGCATTKKSPCKPYRKTINCFQFEDQECKDKLNQFLINLVQGFEQTRKTSDHLTVNTEDGKTYNVKARLDVDIPTMYIDVTYCVSGEVADKERIYIDLWYR
jgi:hypothetical protein